MIETTGEGKSAVATPDGKSRKKKCALIISVLNAIVLLIQPSRLMSPNCGPYKELLRTMKKQKLQWFGHGMW